MSNSLVYNIPTHLIDTYAGRNLIVRSASPNKIVDCLRGSDPGLIHYLQLLSVSADSTELEGFAESLPLEIVLRDPAADYQHLYAFSSLLDSHPLRIAIPVVPGFSKAVRLALSLNFAVKLEMEQPDDILIKEVESVLDLYLHKSSVRQPIEFFQTLLLSFFRNEPISIWEVAEEDPAQIRYITDYGEETISRRFAGVKLTGGLDSFADRYGQQMINERRECHDCEFFNRCGGYFKWPDATYRCEGIKRLFRTLADTSEDVRHDLASYEAMEVQAQP